MNWIKSTCIAISLGTLAGGAATAGPTIEKPVVLEEAMFSVTVSDLHGLIDEIGSVAAQVSPMMGGMMLKNMVGMKLGDPGLAGIAPGKGLSIIALDATNVFAVIEVAEPQMPVYTHAVSAMGMQSVYSNGLLVVAKTAPLTEKGIDLSAKVESTLLAKRSPELRIALQPAAIIEKNNDQIQGMLQMMPMLMGQRMMQEPGATLSSAESTTKILEGELRVFLSLASQCDVAEIVLAPQNGSVRISETFVPKAGSRLATLMNAPVVNTPNPGVASGYLGIGTMGFDASLANQEALMDFMVAETEQLAEEMEISEVDLPGLVALKKKWWEVSSGSLSEVVGMDESGLSVGYLMGIKDETEALAAVQALPQDIEPFLGLYEDLGMSLAQAFKENVREHKGVKIHQFVMDISITNQPPEVAEQLAAMSLTNMVFDIAITDGTMVLSMGDNVIESILDRLADESFKPVPLKARGIYPVGGFYYFDFDIGKYLAFINTFAPDTVDPMMSGQMASLFQGTEPITSAGFKADDQVMWSVNVPGELIAKIGQMAMMMQMQKMQQSQGGLPQAMPVQ